MEWDLDGDQVSPALPLMDPCGESNHAGTQHTAHAGDARCIPGGTVNHAGCGRTAGRRCSGTCWGTEHGTIVECRQSTTLQACGLSRGGSLRGQRMAGSTQWTNSTHFSAAVPIWLAVVVGGRGWGSWLAVIIHAQQSVLIAGTDAQ